VNWIEVRVSGVGDDTRDAIAAALIHAGAGGVVEPTATDLVTYLPPDVDLTALASAVQALSATASIEHAAVGEIDWAARWPTRVGVQRVGRIAVAPPWLAGEIEGSDLSIVIEPAMAFGTGEHETTRGVLYLMQAVVRSGDMVADLGAGSAVLSIAAAKLGAGRVAAIELDPDAVPNAEENVARNGVGDRVTVIEGDARMLLPLLAPVQVILANIISSVLLDLAPAMARALGAGGHAILSGILKSERDMMTHALTERGWTLEAEYAEGEWWSSVIARG
jgi:ribosomal protein L11 methyltransferase